MRAFRAEVEITVEIVLDERDLSSGQHRHESLFRCRGHQAAERIIEIWNHQTSVDLARTQCALEGIKVEPGAWMGGDLQGFQPELRN